MKSKLLSVTLVLSIAMVGCSENPVGESATVEGTNSVEVSIAADPASRISVNAGTDTWSLAWEAGDAVTAWFDSSSAISTISSFAMSADGVGADGFAMFTGDIPLDAASVRFIYPTGVSATIDLAVQSVDLSEDAYMHMGDNNLYMMSDIIACDAIESTPVYMNHLLTFVDLEVKATNVSDDLVVEKVEISGLKNNAASLDFDSADFDAALVDIVSGNITLNVSGASALVEGEALHIPFSAIPMDLVAGEQIVVTLTFTNEHVETVTLTVTDAIAAMGFARATFNSIPVSFEAPAADTRTKIAIWYSDALIMKQSVKNTYSDWMYVSIPSAISEDIPVEFTYNADLIASYNSANGTEYLTLPSSSAVTLNSATLTAGETIAYPSFSIDILDLEFDYKSEYLIPLQMNTSIIPESTKMQDADVYYLVLAKTPCGQYTATESTGYLWDGTVVVAPSINKHEDYAGKG
ncbi:MAG: DUF1735 domain-containing protein, partial [Rikenellaceae bacterium]